MNADERATPPGSAFAPVTPAASAEAPTETGSTPRRSAFRPIAAGTPSGTPAGTPAGTQSGAGPAGPFSVPRSTAPTSATAAPVRTASTAPLARPTQPAPVESNYQWTPATGATAAVAAPTAAGVATAEAPAHSGSGVAGAFTAGTDAFKGFAIRAKKSLTEGDDLTASNKRGGPRKARVLVSRIDPWSVLKMGFLLSVAIGIMLVVAVFVLWNALNQFGLFSLVDQWVNKLFAGEQPVDIIKIFELNKVMSAAILVSVMNVILLTALTTIGAFLYNTVSSVVGGVYVTLTDD